MRLAKVIGTVVATRKDPRLEGKKLLVCRPVDPGKPGQSRNPEKKDEDEDYLVAVDTVQAGFHETVLVVQGSSARMAAGCQDRPIDAAIVGIVDVISMD